jgi:hypothetical protein
MPTLSFHKVNFTAQEVLDFLTERSESYGDDIEGYSAIECAIEAFLDMAEERSRQ